MKTLIENSIAFPTLGRAALPLRKTVFNINSPSEEKHHLYEDIAQLSGKSAPVVYLYAEDDDTQRGSASLIIPAGLDTAEVKAYIIEEINKTLA